MPFLTKELALERLNSNPIKAGKDTDAAKSRITAACLLTKKI
jgi:hypothetical protein